MEDETIDAAVQTALYVRNERLGPLCKDEYTAYVIFVEPL